MVREELIEGAVAFLQDPSVASSPVEQRVAFLQSKNLTQEEIDASLARVGQATPSQASASTSPQYRQAPPQYGYQPPPYWAQAPPEPPRRDWRDYFIIATVMGGVSYGLYWTAKRYIYPVIAPPTPPQLEQDKASMDASFDKAFALLDQLATDTQELKDAEKSRTERLDAALAEVESVVAKIKEANEQRELEAKRTTREIGDIRDQIPRAIEKEREGTDARLKDLGVEMKSLKTLVANRMSGGSAPAARPSSSAAPQSSAPALNGSSIPAPSPAPAPAETNGVNGSAKADDAESASSFLPERSSSASPYASRNLGAKSPSIPAWQLAAKKRSEEAKKADGVNGSATPNLSDSGTITDGEAAT